MKDYKENKSLIEANNNDKSASVVVAENTSATAPVYEEAQQLNLSAKEMKLILERIKDDSLSANPADVINSLAIFNQLIGIDVNMDEISIPELRGIVLQKTLQKPMLNYTFEVIALGNSFCNMALGQSPATIGGIEELFQKARNLYNADIINNNQMAMAYHNISLIYVNMARSHMNEKKQKDFYNTANKYMLDALSLTDDIKLIKVCDTFLDNKTKYKNKILQNACERALQKTSNRDVIDRFQIYSLYAKTFENTGINKLSDTQHLNEKKAASYYEEALKYAVSEEDIMGTLRNIASMQKIFDTQAYAKTKLAMIENLEGKRKVLELIKLSKVSEINNVTKTKLLETATNELVDAKSIPSGEKLLLWKNINTDLTKLYGNNKRKINTLNEIGNKFFSIKDTREIPQNLNRRSSKGNNYFSR